MAITSALHRFDIAGASVVALFEPGERPPVLLLHGNSVDHSFFASQIIALRQHGFGVLALDLPGHGLSDPAVAPATTYSIPGYADAVVGVLDALALDRVHVAGWSLGGHVGLELMGRGERVRSLFVWGTPPVKPEPAALREAFLDSEEMRFSSQAELNLEQRARYARAMAADDATAELVAAAVARTDGAARKWLMTNSLAGHGLDERALVARDPRPLAVLHGADDPFVRLSYLRGLTYRNLWRGAVQVLPGVGHAAHLQVPEAFDAALLDFLLSAS